MPACSNNRKTSLLNILASRVPYSNSSYTKLIGTIHVNGKIRNDNEFRKISAYVLQDDLMYSHLTIYETLLLATHFYFPEIYSYEQKLQHVDAILMELGLIKSKDTIIGDAKVRGISEVVNDVVLVLQYNYYQILQYYF